MMFDYDEYDFEDYDSDGLVNKSVSDLLWKIEDAVKQKYEKQIEDLRHELEELKDFKNDYNRFVNEVNSYKRQLEETKRQVREEATKTASEGIFISKPTAFAISAQ